jgi:ubiquinone/menaquinone biosynthesis C-methylase UbiE
MLVSAIEGHRLWAPDYDTVPNPLLAVESRILKHLLNGAAPRSVADVGCGTGRWMLHFNRAGSEVIGVDACPEMLAQAALHRPLRGKLILGDAQDLPLADGVADLVVCSFTASYIHGLNRLMHQLARITVAGGRIVLTDMHHVAAKAGWQRSFKRGASLYQLKHFDYSPPQFRVAAEAQGLYFETEAKGHFGDEEWILFHCADKTHLYCELASIPAVWVGIWSKP